MFMRKDITDLNPNENLHQMANELITYAVNDLIFTSAGDVMENPNIDVNKSGKGFSKKLDIDPWDIDLFDPVPRVEDEPVKKKCENGCGCNGCDDEHGDNVDWW